MTNLTIRDGYGQTETTLLTASFRCLENKAGSMGKPAPGIDMRVGLNMFIQILKQVSCNFRYLTII